MDSQQFLSTLFGKNYKPLGGFVFEDALMKNATHEALPNDIEILTLLMI